MAATLAACGSTEGPSSAVSLLSLAVQTAEWDAERNLVVVGENASAVIDTRTDQGCLTDGPCSVSADVEVRSSNSAVLSAQHQRVRTPATVALVAHTPGTTTVTVTVDGLTESKRVDVVAAPLPLDAIRVTLISAWNDLPVQYDESQSLMWVEVPVDEYGALEIVPLRGGAEVFGVPIYISSYPYEIAQATTQCRPVRIDPQCSVFSDGWIWGVAPGDAPVIVSARVLCRPFDAAPCSSTSTTFTAHVVESQ
jgi:hypothetical protein